MTINHTCFRYDDFCDWTIVYFIQEKDFPLQINFCSRPPKIWQYKWDPRPHSNAHVLKICPNNSAALESRVTSCGITEHWRGTNSIMSQHVLWYSTSTSSLESDVPVSPLEVPYEWLRNRALNPTHKSRDQLTSHQSSFFKRKWTLLHSPFSVSLSSRVGNLSCDFIYSLFEVYKGKLSPLPSFV